MKHLKREERTYFSKLLKHIIMNPRSVFYEDSLLIRQWIKLQKNGKKHEQK